MTKLIMFSMMAMVTMPAFANVAPDDIPLPSPEVLPLLAIGAAAVILARRSKKKS